MPNKDFEEGREFGRLEDRLLFLLSDKSDSVSFARMMKGQMPSDPLPEILESYKRYEFLAKKHALSEKEHPYLSISTQSRQIMDEYETQRRVCDDFAVNEEY